MAKNCPHGGNENDPCIRCAMDDTPTPTIHVNLVVDESPSMLGRWPQTISGLNEYFDSLRQDQIENHQDYRVTMVVFGDHSRRLYNDVILDSIPKFTHENFKCAGNGTALWDAVGDAIEKINTSEPVLFVVLTDGEENMSRNWDKTKVNALMEERAKLGNYTYAYLGVTKDSWGNAAGMTRSMSVNNIGSSAAAYAGSYTALGSSSRSYSSSIRGASALRKMAATPEAANAVSMSVTNFWDGTTSDENSNTVVTTTTSTDTK